MAPPATQDGSSSKPIVLLADPLIPEFEQELAPSYRLLPAADADEAAAASARALLTVDLPAVTAAQIDALPALELVVASSAGVDHINLGACRRRGSRSPMPRTRSPPTPQTTPSACSWPCSAESLPPTRTSGAAPAAAAGDYPLASKVLADLGGKKIEVNRNANPMISLSRR